MIDYLYLETATNAIKTDSTGPYLHGAYSSLYSAVIIPPARELAPVALRSAISRVTEDLWDALTIVWRVEWQRGMKREGHLDDTKWMYFVGTDVRELHVALRAFYDSLCILIRPVLEKPGQVPLDSFRKLKQWIEKPGNDERIGSDLATEISAAKWFDDLRSVRDGLVHNGARPLVFPQIERIGFQVHRRNWEGLALEGVMINENVVDLELYSTVQIAQAIGFLQRLCQLLLVRIGCPDHTENAKAYHPALGLIKVRAQGLMESRNVMLDTRDAGDSG